MSLQYRAIWRGNCPDIIETGRNTFQAWLTSKDISLDIPTEGASEYNGNRVIVNSVERPQVRALRIRLDEVRPVTQGEEQWSTTALWMTDGTEGWNWIDLNWVSHDIYQRPPDISAPRLISMLLARQAERNRLDIRAEPRFVEEGDLVDLVEWLYDGDRSVPVVIYSFDERIDRDLLVSRADQSARRLAGCADVRILTDVSQVLFDRVMASKELSVFDGAVRIYLPGIDENDPHPWRHRYILPQFLPENPFKAANPVMTRILPRVIAQQPPLFYRRHVAKWLGIDERDWQKYAIELDEELRRLQEEFADMREYRDLAIEEATESERSHHKISSSVRSLRSELRKTGTNPDVIEQNIEISDPVSCSEAIELAGSLEHVVIHPNAPTNIESLDSHEDAELWGRRTYRHLRALDSYVESKSGGYNGGFVDWCDNSGHDDVITASKFVAMKESQFVRNSQLIRHRRLPIDQRVHAEGYITMEAHLKPIQGGGLQIPRIYFHDDTRGVTGKVHIGFVGPHELMPNKSAN